MSGTKRITVDEQTWLDVRQKAARLRDVNRELPAMIEAVRQAQQEQAQRDRAQMQARQDEVSRSLADLSEQARRLEEGTSRRIRATTDRMLTQARDSARKVRAETRQLLDEQEQRFEAELAKEREERRRDVASLRQDVAVVRDSHDRALAAASAAAADARLLHDAIAAGLPHERYAPGQLAALDKQLAAAEANVAQGLGETALAQAQGAYLGLSGLRVDLELRDAEWRAAHLAAMAAVTALVEQIKYNAVLQVTDDEADEATDLDVNFWSDGELAVIRERADALAARVGDAAAPPPLAELRDISERDVAALDQKITEAVTKARTRQWGSQVRVNLAEMVVDALQETTGYQWRGDATYAGQDMRGAFYSKLRHPDASEIVVEVAPDETGESCVLRILSYESGVPDESERVERAHAIADSLRERGLQTGPPTADPLPPDPELTDFDKLREAKRAVTQQA